MVNLSPALLEQRLNLNFNVRTQADPYLETREREELFVKQIVDAVENSLKQTLPLFLSGLTAGMAQREPQISNVINLRKFRLLQ